MLTRRVFIKGVIGTAAVATVVPFEALADSEVVYKITRSPDPKVFHIANQTNILRTITLLKRDLASVLNQFVFEPNVGSTRNSVKAAVDQRLDKWVENRIVDDYIVVCDRLNNTPDTIDSNKLVVDIAVKFPQKIDYVHIHTELSASGQSFTPGRPVTRA